MSLNYFLYSITNNLNNRKYIGITNRPDKRWREHKLPSSTCTKIRNSIQKHGSENFTFKILVCGDQNYILDLEKRAIDLYDTINNGYNLIYGDPRLGTGVTCSRETVEKRTKSLIEHYKNNKSKNIGTISVQRKSIYCRGFVFPSVSMAKKILGVKSETLNEYYKTGQACKLNNEEQINKVNHYEYLQTIKTKRKRARENASSVLAKLLKRQRYKKVSDHHIKNNPMKDVVGAKHHNSRPVVIEGVGYASISTAKRITGFSKSILEKRIKKNIKGFEYFDMNKHQHLTLIDG